MSNQQEIIKRHDAEYITQVAYRLWLKEVSPEIYFSEENQENFLYDDFHNFCEWIYNEKLNDYNFSLIDNLDDLLEKKVYFEAICKEFEKQYIFWQY